MAKIMEIIEKETRGKSYHTYKYSYDSIGLPSIDYDDDPNKIIKWKDSGETGSPKNLIFKNLCATLPLLPISFNHLICYPYSLALSRFVLIRINQCIN